MPPVSDPPRGESRARRPGSEFLLLVSWLVAAVMLAFAAVGKHPYSYYTLLRWVCCSIFAYSTVAQADRHRRALVWVFAVLAALYNPIVRVHLDRGAWAVVNWLTIGALVVAALASFWNRMGGAKRKS